MSAESMQDAKQQVEKQTRSNGLDLTPVEKEILLGQRVQTPAKFRRTTTGMMEEICHLRGREGVLMELVAKQQKQLASLAQRSGPGSVASPAPKPFPKPREVKKEPHTPTGGQIRSSQPPVATSHAQQALQTQAERRVETQTQETLRLHQPPTFRAPSPPQGNGSKSLRTQARLVAILELAEQFGLCTRNQRQMMLDYVENGRFDSQYYIDMWTKRLEISSSESAAALRRLSVGAGDGHHVKLDKERVGQQGQQTAADSTATTFRVEPVSPNSQATTIPAILGASQATQATLVEACVDPALSSCRSAVAPSAGNRSVTASQQKIPMAPREKIARAQQERRAREAAAKAEAAAKITAENASNQACLNAKEHDQNQWGDAPHELVKRTTRMFGAEENPCEEGDSLGDLEGGEWRISTISPNRIEINGASGSRQQSFSLPRGLYARIWPYQRAGVAWMAKLFQARQGGILADEMGLGKTVQACAFLAGIRHAGATHALVIMPVTLLDQWVREVSRWCPDWPVHTYYGTERQRTNALEAVMQPAGGILLTTYAVLKNDGERLFQVLPSSSADGTCIAQQISTSQGNAEKVASGNGRSPGRGKGKGKGKRKRLADVDEEEDALFLGKSPRKPKPSVVSHRVDGDIGKKTNSWDVVLCDEAHAMRNMATLLGRRLRQIRASARFLLTGTPVQNALQDLWALMDFAQPGLLGNHATFVKRFNDPIERGSVRGAPIAAIALKKHLCEQLLELIKPHMLRRTKASVGLVGQEPQSTDLAAALAVPSAEGGQQKEIQTSSGVRSLPPKAETVIWLKPTEEQVLAYQKLLEKNEVIQEANAKAKLGLEVFQAIALLKRMCNHPLMGLPTTMPGAWEELLSDAIAELDPQLSGNKRRRVDVSTRGGAIIKTIGGGADAGAGAGPDASKETEEEDVSAGKAVEAMLKKLPRDIEALISQCAKLRCLAKLLPALAVRNHRTLVFCQGTKLMDLVELCILRRQGLKYLRIDGKVDAASRAERVKHFQADTGEFQFLLLTTSVGGYGLNLTSADRVVILDPAWNPATDIQAVDRAYRIGQTRSVRVYRLIMSGLIEDKIFRLQVHKMGLTKTALDGRQQQVYFTSNEIRGLFKWTDPEEGETRKILIEKNGPEHDEEVERLAKDDGADQGWLGSGPAIGLSNFATLHSALAQLAQGEENVDADEGLPELREMKGKIGDADQLVHCTEEARVTVEDRLATAKQGIDDAAAQLPEASAAKSEAAGLMKKHQAALTDVRRRQQKAEERTEKAFRARAAAQEQFSRTEEHQGQSDRAFTIVTRATVDAAEAISAAEEILVKALAGAKSTCAIVDMDGYAVSGNVVDVGLVKLRAVNKAYERASAAVEAAQASRAVAASSEDAVLQACHDVVQTAAGQNKQATLKACEKERTRAETARNKARERAESTREAAAQAIGTLVEAGLSFADGFRASASTSVVVTAAQVKLAQQSAKAAMKQCSVAWQSVKSSHEAWAKSACTRGKAADKATSARLAHFEATQRFANTEADLNNAKAEEEQLNIERQTCEADFANAEATRLAADTLEMSLKHKRIECKAALGAAKESLKSAKAAEREALAGRAAVIAHFSNSGRGRGSGKLTTKAALAADPSEAVSMSSVTEALSAVKALKGEDYDPNQVDQAYQAKKKQRLDIAQRPEDHDAAN